MGTDAAAIRLRARDAALEAQTILATSQRLFAGIANGYPLSCMRSIGTGDVRMDLQLRELEQMRTILREATTQATRIRQESQDVLASRARPGEGSAVATRQGSTQPG